MSHRKDNKNQQVVPYNQNNPYNPSLWPKYTQDQRNQIARDEVDYINQEIKEQQIAKKAAEEQRKSAEESLKNYISALKPVESPKLSVGAEAERKGAEQTEKAQAQLNIPLFTSKDRELQDSVRNNILIYQKRIQKRQDEIDKQIEAIQKLETMKSRWDYYIKNQRFPRRPSPLPQ